MRQLVDHVNFTGTTRATATVELRARVSGYLQRLAFDDGASVKRGDLLFVIETAPVRAVLESKIADLERAKAAMQLAQVELKRTELLLAKGSDGVIHLGGKKDGDSKRNAAGNDPRLSRICTL